MKHQFCDNYSNVENCTNWKQYERIMLVPVVLTVSSYSDLV